jgi:ligand-binding sensor domain-containing protein/two-component sensor histidine kinase
MPGKHSRFGLIIIIGVALFQPELSAQQLPVRYYTVNDGLPHNTVNDILSDSHGFLWFATPSGLSRFNGYEFTNYRMDDWPSARVNTLLETRSGEYWAGTGAGLYRFDPRAKPTRFEVYWPDNLPVEIRAIFQDRSGQLWCGAGAGLYRVDPSAAGAEAFHFIDLGVPLEVEAFAEDPAGNLWIGTTRGLFRRNPGGHIDRYWDDDWSASGRAHVNALLLDRNETLWAATWGGLWRITLPSGPGTLPAKRVPGLPDQYVWSVFQSGDGQLWAGTPPGLLAIDPEKARVIQLYSTVRQAVVVKEDSEGNLWVANSDGAGRIARPGFWSYPAEYNIIGSNGPRDEPTDIIESHAGELIIGSNFSVDVLEQGHLTKVQPQFSSGISAGWGWYQTVLQDREDDWWFPTAQGLFRFGPARSAKSLAGLRPKAIYTQRDGPTYGAIFRVFEDRAGNIWVASQGRKPGENGLSCWVRSTGKWHDYSRDPALPVLREELISSLAQDQSDALWIGFYNGHLARFRDGLFQFFTEGDGWVGGGVRAIHEDRYGALWIGSSGGLTRIGNPDAQHPGLQTFKTAQGLSSNDIQAVISDNSGRIYASTGAGIDEIEPVGSGNSVSLAHIRHYTTSDGLASKRLHIAFRDRAGVVWFGDNEGLSRFQPAPAHSHPSPVMIHALRIAGVTFPVADLGETAITLPSLRAAQNNVQVEYSGLNLVAGETLRYQYMLEGADKGWSEPTAQHAVYYSSLSPGKYRFLVRAVRTDGTMGQPATVSFIVLAPFWRRGWFVALLLTTILAAAYLAHRYRVSQLLALERVRTRIATDLHDDIGSSLSQIAILSEVAHRRVDGQSPDLAAPLDDIASISREVVSSMSDIVWSLDPEQDHFKDLCYRIRRFATDVLTSRDIRLRFEAPAGDLPLEPHLRRQLLLIVKEAVHNVVRHSACTEAAILFRLEQGSLRLRVWDNGNGINPDTAGRGHGLRSMRERAMEIGGEIQISSSPQLGTTIDLCVPFPGRSREVFPHKYAGRLP